MLVFDLTFFFPYLAGLNFIFLATLTASLLSSSVNPLAMAAFSTRPLVSMMQDTIIFPEVLLDCPGGFLKFFCKNFFIDSFPFWNFGSV